MKGLSIEAKVGLLILVAVGLVGAFVLFLGGVNLGERYPLYVDFDNPGNLQPGTSVNIGSIKVGRVEEVEYLGGRLDPQTGRRPLIRVKVELDAHVQDTIHEDALFYVTSNSVLSEAILAIDPGDPEKPALEPGDIVVGVDPPRLDLALALAYELLEGVSRLLRDNREELETLLASAANAIRQLDALLQENDGRFDRILANVETATTETTALLADARGTLNGPRVQRSLRNIDQTLNTVQSQIAPLLADARSATRRADLALGAFGPDQQAQFQSALADAANLAETANSAVGDARQIVAHIRSGQGSVGAMVMDEELYDDVQELLRDLKHNPWKLFWRE